MSGHSKWHNIQGRKGKQDAVKSNVFTKLAKGIAVAAQNGGDPLTNFALRLAVDKAKAGGMPKDNIDRAIKRGTGEFKEGVHMEEALYEGFGPSGVAVLVKVITDNKNRTLPEIKKIFSSHGGSIGGSGSVQWMFEQLGIITVLKEKITNKDEFELQLIETGAQDIVEYELGIEIKTRVENFQKILQKIKELNIEPIRSGIEWVAKEPVNVSEEVQKSLGSLFEALEEHEDVEDFFTNAH